MHFELKKISADSIPEALAKVERYRLLNEPKLAESICLDILATTPDHQQALIALLLARTDQFDSNDLNAKGAHEVLAKIKGEYERAYYAGIIWERLAHSYIHQGIHGQSSSAYHALRGAMEYFEKASKLSPQGNDDAILRWNTCARVIMQHPAICPTQDEQPEDAWVPAEADSHIPDV